MKAQLITFAVWLVAAGISAAQDVTVEGTLVDGQTGVPIAGGQIRAGGQQVITDEQGRFTLSLPPGPWTLDVTFSGYLDTRFPIEVGEKGLRELELLLFPQTVYTESVEVRESLPKPEGPSSNPVVPQEVFEVAGSIDNIYRTLDTLPGVAATEDFGSRLSVRGGSPDQNLTIMDGVEIHNPYRLFGLTSAFNPETVETFDLTAGGFSAKYGDRLSSLLVVQNRSGRDKLGGSASVSITDANVVVEGATPGDAKGSWFVTARRTYYDLVAGRINNENYPSFADVQFKAAWEFGRGHRLSFQGLASREESDFFIEDDERPDEGGNLVNDAVNDLVSVRFDALLGDHATSATIVSWYRNRDVLDFDGAFRSEARRSNDPDDNIAFGLSDILFDRELFVRDISLREEITIEATPQHLMDVGLELHSLRTGIVFFTQGDRNVEEANGSSIRGGAGLPDELESLLNGTRGGFWFQDRIAIGPKWTLEPGIRFDWSTINSRGTVSPRFATSYEVGNGFRLQGALGLFTQSPGYEKLIQSDYFIDLTGSSELGIRHERAAHVIVGIEKDLGLNTLLRVEGYYKRFDRRIVGRLETDEELAERLARYDFPEELQDDIPTDRIITSAPTNGGSGTAYGVDVYLALREPGARLNGWLSYTLGKADQESYSQLFSLDYDRRHALNVVGRYRLSNKFDIALTGRVASGFPRTSPLGLRVAAVEDERGMLIPDVDANGNYVYTIDLGGVENLNRGRLPYYARFDIRGTFRPGGLTGRWSFYVEVINVLNRDNAITLNNELVYDPSSDLPRITEVPNEGFPLIPSFGVRFRF
jgi:hypothetical protein